ncbi:FAD-dependent oxidoreductase [Ciceribacter sp. L1K23]|uniref:NAD(P)/FAD-dependent oxidoreductase n=1 Tax=Ciceribacter sp. L1K23 TaxID=2820276 RepID=UPI001B810DA9|nr:FAD-dependent oxidoreductase [Ciceribacter sp. L1K23]MBR0558004.1 FAD-dependent oxidoreductase [Ciceribacter sp. L1K23]
MDHLHNIVPLHHRRRIAVIGSGISGLSAAWLLSRGNEVVLYEADKRPGGHSNTVDIEGSNGKVPVDTGFIVYNERNYPNLVALFEHLGVKTDPSNMSFSASLRGGTFEYSGSGLGGLLGQRTNAFRPRFWRMVRGILEFYRQAPELLKRRDLDGVTLGEYLDANGYDHGFVEDHLLPMGAAIWSTTAADMRAYPLIAFIRFFVNHGLVVLKDRPAWRTVSGGSREYVSRLLADFRGEVRLGQPVRSVRRDANGCTVTGMDGHADRFDQVVIATHADQALAMLEDGDDLERKTLGAFDYTRNTTILHTDEKLMPRRKRVWASWNYIGEAGDDDGNALCVTYWMNKLQNLQDVPPVFVTLNPSRPISEDKILATFDYAHPLFDAKALSAQQRLWHLQGRRNTWFCGAHFGSGFHEDGLQSGLAVAEALGGLKRPWRVENESARIFIDQQLVAAE